MATRIAVTGTPGVGKTTLAAELANHLPGEVVVDSLLELARRHNCIAGFDDEDDAEVIDVNALASRMPFPTARFHVIDGHLAHLIPVDVAFVIRLDPLVLRPRLEARGYSDAKVQENLEAEAMDLILQEALEMAPQVIQRDGTQRTPSMLAASFVDSLSAGTKVRPDIEPVDWSDQLPFGL